LWQAARDGDPFALMLVDVDHFKRFNDHYGHGAGDACLCEISRLLTARAGGSADLVSRYGGEEFALLLPGLDSRAAMALAERIRLALNARALPHAGRGDGLGHVTVSIGVAASPDGAKTPDALVEAADAALYRAKSAGRNRAGCEGTRNRPEAAPGSGAEPALAAWPVAGDPPRRRSA
jgi:diguanylate cyclase (GGDEF)-like protein